MKKTLIHTFLAVTVLCSGAMADYSLEYNDTSHPVRKVMVDDIEYLSLSDFCQALGGGWYWNPMNKKLVLTMGGHQFKFTLFSPYVIVDQETYNLTYPIEFKEADLVAPTATFLELVQFLLSLQLEWEPGDGKIEIVQRELDITSLKATPKANGVLVEIFLARPLQYELFTTADNWLHINFFSAKLNPEEIQLVSSPAIQEIKAYVFPDNTCQISIKLKRPFNRYQAELKEDPERLRVSLADTTLSPKINSQVFNEKEVLENNPIDVIVIDPGHGGEDTGAKGPGGAVEKEVVLEISQKVAQLLREDGFKVILTREEDVFIPLEDRSALANKKGADLFISIHANAAKRKQASGSETYFLSRAKNDESRAVATLENASLRFEKPELYVEGMEDLEFILLDMTQNEFLKESQDLAALIQDKMEDFLPIPNRGVDQAGFFVLNKTYMPAVLVETAFITNANEARLLKSDSFQEKVARAIAGAVKEFKHKYEKLNSAQR